MNSRFHFPLLASMAFALFILAHPILAEAFGSGELKGRMSSGTNGVQNKYVFVEYKHIARLPDQAIGERVKMGQAIAETGNTGTDQASRH